MNSNNGTLFDDVLIKKGLYDFRSIFYLLTPNETYFEHTKDVPDLTENANNIFFAIILVEQLICLVKYGRFNGNLNDAITSVSAGMISTFPRFYFRKISFSTYEWVYEHCLIYELPWNNIITYIITFLFVDMMYYWFHRAAHEINLFWAAHQTHHSSERYNLTSALRQSIFQSYTSWAFYLPLALFVRPSIFMIHSHMNLIYQFWIHTEVVDNIGPLEYILNTASHHRVHHGRNPYCIDKNYAAVLIIWDRMFGTFEAEKKDEKIAYGLVHPLTTFDPIYIQVFNYQYIFKRFFESKSWNERLSVLFKGPGWVPGSPRLGYADQIPKIEYRINMYGKKLPMLNVYVTIHFIFLIILFTSFANESHKYPIIFVSFAIGSILFCLTSFGLMLMTSRMRLHSIQYDVFYS